MGESFVEEVGKFWTNSSGDLLSKLGVLKEGLIKWAKQVKRKREGIKRYLNSRMEELLKAEKDDENLVDLIDKKIGLNI